MSFLYDPETYLDIIKSEIQKQAQAAEFTNHNQVAKKLVNRLSRELTGGAEPVNVSADSPTPVNLAVENLQNLGSLLQFLDTNQVKVDGTRVAYDQAESDTLPETEQAKLSPITINLSRDAFTRKWNTADYYTNLPALIQYVRYLQDKAKSEDNKVLSVIVGKLVDQVNQVKPDSGLARQPKSVPGQTANELPDETVLDGFGSKVFDIKKPLGDRGGLSLKAADIKSKEALNAWMMSGPEAQIVQYDAEGKPSTFKYSDDRANLCLVIGTLYKRAQRLLQLSQSPEDSKKYNFFLKKIQDIGPSFSSPDGKACIVSKDYVGDTKLVSYKPGEEPSGTTTETGTGGTAAVNPQYLYQLTSSLPLAVRDINLDRIQNFFRLMEGLSTGERGSRVQNYINDAEQRMQVLKSMMLNADAIYPTGISPREFAAGLKNQQMPGKSYLPALDRLKEIVNITRRVIEELYSAYGDKFDANQRAAILGQIGRNSTDNSIYRRNIEDIDGLKHGVNQVVKVR